MKMEISNHLLSEKPDTLTVALDVKSIIRAALSTVGAYRLLMGEKHFDAITGDILDAQSPDQVDFTWRGALGIVGKMFLEFVEAER